MMTESAKEVGSYLTSDSWQTYDIANAFSMSVPPTMELKPIFNEYASEGYEGINLNNSEAVFQQKGLSDSSPSAYDTYCRIIVHYYDGDPGDTPHHNETSVITPDDRKFLKEIIDEEVLPQSYISGPSYQWIDISGTKAVEARYQKTGTNGPVTCRMYILFNYDEMVTIIVAYRESDADKWEADMQNVIRTFEWNAPS